MAVTKDRAVTQRDLEGEMLKLRDSLDRWRVPVQAEIDRHRQTIYGNGDPGLDERIRNIERSLKTLIQMAWVATSTIAGYVTLEVFKMVFAK